jgi:deazaflavin-dependent oxidoreductase (nitroreductase family)
MASASTVLTGAAGCRSFPAMEAPRFVRRGVQRLAGSDRFAAIAPRFIPAADRALSKITRGRLMLSQWVVPSIVLTSTGAKSGQPRRSPLAAVPLEGDYFVVASNFGQERHPAWSYNLMAEPRATMTVHGKDRTVDCQLLTPEQKATIWPELTKVWPPYDRYAERSGRDLRVFRLVAVD